MMPDDFEEETGRDDTLERQQYEEDNSFVEDFISLQRALENPIYDKVNPHFNHPFASLESVIKSTIKVANKFNFAIVQELINDDEKGIGCSTHIMHRNGVNRIFGPFFVQPVNASPHGAGSAATYAKRYSLMAIFGVGGETDDDGNAASPVPSNNFDQLEELQ
tara:strand:- start:739 stop:1227 length:489 start_codon:yes stop_codon:yes gene_type:complete